MFLFFFLCFSFFLFFFFFFFFNDTATTEIYTLSLHDALPISDCGPRAAWGRWCCRSTGDRKSTRLNSSHSSISYAVFCLKKKKKKKKQKTIKKKIKKKKKRQKLKKID